MLDPIWDFFKNLFVKRTFSKIVTQTVFTTPPPLDRKVVGVCEQVTCTVTPGPVKATVSWTNSDGWIFPRQEPSTTFIAPDYPKNNVTVTAMLSTGGDSSVHFTVLRPHVMMEVDHVNQAIKNPLGLDFHGKAI